MLGWLRRLSSTSKSNHVSINKHILACQSAAEIEQFVLQNSHPLNDVNLSTAFRTLASHRSRNLDAFSKLVELSRPVSFSPRALSSICHSLAKTKPFAKLPVVFVDKISTASLQHFPAQSISNTVWSLASLAQPSPELFNRVGDHLVQLPSLSEFSPQALSSTLWAFASLKHNHRPLFAKVDGEIRSRGASAFGPQAISNVAWSYASLGYTDKEVGKMFRMLGNAATVDTGSFSPLSYANLCWSLAKAGVNHPPLFTHVAAKLPALLPTLDSLVLVKLCWSFATTEHPDKAVFAAFANELLTRERSRGFTMPQGYLSNIMWALVKADAYEPQLFDVFSRILCKQPLRETKAVSVILWSLATCGRHHDALLLDHLTQELLCCDLESFEPQTVSNTMWSLATLNYEQHGPVTDWLVRQMLKGTWEFNARQMGNICWAMATLQMSNSELFTKFANELAGQDLSRFDPQVLSNLLWAFGKTNFTHPAALGAMASEMKRANLNRFTPQALSNSLLAMAALNYVDVALLDTVSAHLERCQALDRFSSQSISNILWAFKSLEYRSEGALAVLAGEMERRAGLESFSAQTCSNVLLAFAKLDYTGHPKLLGLLVKQLSANNNGGGDALVQPVINSMWAVACLDAFALEHVREWFASSSLVVAAAAETELDNVCAQQLLQVKVAWEQQQQPIGPSPLIKSMHRSSSLPLLLTHHQSPKSSRVHLGISTLLRRELGGEVVVLDEAVLLDGAAQVDIYLPKHNLVVEVDGPNHYFVNLPSVQSGSTKLKHRLLRRAGFELVSIPVSEFTSLSAQDQAQYISKLVCDHVTRP